MIVFQMHLLSISGYFWAILDIHVSFQGGVYHIVNIIPLMILANSSRLDAENPAGDGADPDDAGGERGPGHVRSCLGP